MFLSLPRAETLDARNPFNGIERRSMPVKMLKKNKKGNPFNGIESSFDLNLRA